MALPIDYLTDQPDLDSHFAAFKGRVRTFTKNVIEKVPAFLNGSIEIDDKSLKKLEDDWTSALKRLTHSKDEINDKHLYRPIVVCCLKN